MGTPSALLEVDAGGRWLGDDGIHGDVALLGSTEADRKLGSASVADPREIVLHEITELDLRQVFPREDTAFTPWLAAPNNLRRLADVLGCELELLATEVRSETFRTDILAQRADDGALVVIENQFGRSDHDHMGKALTYLATHDAKLVVWIAEAFADEHRATLNWLNQNTSEEHGFFGVVPKLIRIGDSPPGLRFDVVERPNQLVKSVRSGDKRISERVFEVRSPFWTSFMEALQADPVLGACTTRYGGRSGYLWLIPPDAPQVAGQPAHLLVYITAGQSGTDSVNYGVGANQAEDPEGMAFANAVWANALEAMGSRAVEPGIVQDLERQPTWHYAKFEADLGTDKSRRAAIETALPAIRCAYEALMAECGLSD